MVKRVVISAAGRGTRMKHLSQDKPKHMIQVQGRPFLYYLLTNLEKAGFEDIIIVIGYQSRHIEDYIGRGHHARVRLVNQFERMGEEKYGTAIPLLAAKEELGNEEFVAVYGDNLYSVRDLRKFNDPDGMMYVAGLAHDHPENYGILIYGADGFLERIVEKPKTDVGSNIINTGLMKLTPEIFDALLRVNPNSDNGEYYLVDALTECAGQKKVKVKLLQDYWLDFGKPEDIETLSEFLNKK